MTQILQIDSKILFINDRSSCPFTALLASAKEGEGRRWCSGGTVARARTGLPPEWHASLNPRVDALYVLCLLLVVIPTLRVFCLVLFSF